jgi:uncharacterized protein
MLPTMTPIAPTARPGVTVLFKKSKELESQIDEFLDLIVSGGLLFRQGVRFYLQDRSEEFEQRLEDLRNTERQADMLRRGIESRLYIHTLIPESRGDVLGLLESADKVLNIITATLLKLAVEQPETPFDLNDLFLDLADASIAAEEQMVKSIRAYFRDVNHVRDHIGQVQFFREESNRLAEKYKRTVFRRELRLSHKIHLRYFTEHVERIAEEAEDVSDRVAIAAIKRFE